MLALPENNIHFQNLPFYETGTIEKNPMGEEDVLITMDLLEEVKPHQIFVPVIWPIRMVHIKFVWMLFWKHCAE